MTCNHSHTQTVIGNESMAARMGWALGLTLAFVIVEIIAGLWANSLALLTDAAHNATDVIALGLSWYAIRLAERPAHSGKTFGYHRAGILVALVNSTSLVLIALGIFYEAFRRLMHPPQVTAKILIGVGAAAFVVNVITAWLVKKGNEEDLNLRSAFLHLMGDVLSTLGAVLAGIAIAFTGMNWLDPLVSFLIGLLIIWNAWGILIETLEILLESTPRNIDMSAMVRDLMQISGVLGVHDLHVWSINRSLRNLSAHIVTGDIPIREGAIIQSKITQVLSQQYGIDHTTLQLECEGCDPDHLYCDMTKANHNHTHIEQNETVEELALRNGIPAVSE